MVCNSGALCGNQGSGSSNFQWTQLQYHKGMLYWLCVNTFNYMRPWSLTVSVSRLSFHQLRLPTMLTVRTCAFKQACMCINVHIFSRSPRVSCLISFTDNCSHCFTDNCSHKKTDNRRCLTNSSGSSWYRFDSLVLTFPHWQTCASL